jgi:protein-S-isoprenylcysteine O-methyltransferase Ste14
VNPLYLHDDGANALVTGALALWAAVEIYLRWRNRAGRSEPEWSFFVVFGSITLGFVLGFGLEHVDSTVIGGGWTAVLVGTAILLGGAAFRIWAILALGRFFKFTVSIQRDHRVVDTGPYRRLRHPSYTGLLVGLLGLGLALDNWLSLLALVVVPLIGVLLRIRAEEAALSQALGESYRSYAARTDRLIPGIW